MRVLYRLAAFAAIGICRVGGQIVFCDPAPTDPPQLCPDGSQCGGLDGSCPTDDPSNPAPAGHCRCPCGSTHMTNRLQDIFSVCGGPNCPSSFPMTNTGELQACPLDCATLFLSFMDECRVEMQEQHGPGLGDPDPNPFFQFETECGSAIRRQGMCTDDPDWVASGSGRGCTNAYDDQFGEGQCAALLASATASCENFLPGGGPVQGHSLVGYCDKECHGGSCGGCAALDACSCEGSHGLVNCPETCNAFCAAVASDDRAQQPITIRVPAAGAVPTPVMGNIVDTQCAANSQGKHQWFRFTAVAGHVYQINTELVAGGLLSTWLHLHVLDDDQTELLAAKAWHCPAVPGVLANGGASCVIWSCTANGDYSIRVQRYSGSGAFKVAVQDVGTVVDLATREGLRPLITDTNPNKGVYTVDTGPHGDWTIALDVACEMLYCHFFRKEGTYTPGIRDGGSYTPGSYSGTADNTEMTSDGEHLVMSIQGRQGATYTFNLDLLDPDRAGVYVKLTVHPDKAQGGAEAFSGNPDMEREIKLGDWDVTQPGHHSYEEYNPDYDVREYKNPGLGHWQCVGSCRVSPDGMSEQFSAAGHWKWTAPADGDYFVTITSNCDVAVLDDVESNFDVQAGHTAPGHDGALGCQSSFGMSLHVEDEHTVLVVPIISALPPCASETGSACQHGQNVISAHSQPAMIQTLTETRVACSCLSAVPPTCTSCDAENPTQVASDLCDPTNLPETYTADMQQLCADTAMMFVPAVSMLAPLPLPPLGPATSGHRRQMRGGGNHNLNGGVSYHETLDTGTGVSFQEMRNPNAESALLAAHNQQLNHCAQVGIQPGQCGNGRVVEGLQGSQAGRRRIQEASRVAQAVAAGSDPLTVSQERVTKLEAENARLLEELRAVRAERDLYQRLAQ